MPQGGRPMISVRGVTKCFGAHRVLDSFDLDVGDQEKLALIGRSGSGKSTLLRILMTLEDIQSGEVEIDGELLWRSSGGASVCERGTRLRAIRGKVGMVFQQFNLFPHMTALRNVSEAPVRVLGIRREEAEQRALELLELVGLADRARSYPVQLSGGQQQRVAIARALAMRPRVLLFDEVTSALDPELVGEVLSVIRMLAQTSKCTMIMVTHQMGFAREFADRVCFLESGRLIEQGSPEEIFRSPRNERTRSFLRAVLEA
jgi:polar amino acid transport system ATP-binding protein